jgi:hypothetical protein
MAQEDSRKWKRRPRFVGTRHYQLTGTGASACYLRDVEGKTFQAIADMLSLTRQAAWQHYWRHKNLLRLRQPEQFSEQSDGA